MIRSMARKSSNKESGKVSIINLSERVNNMRVICFSLDLVVWFFDALSLFLVGDGFGTRSTEFV